MTIISARLRAILVSAIASFYKMIPTNWYWASGNGTGAARSYSSRDDCKRKATLTRSSRRRSPCRPSGLVPQHRACSISSAAAVPNSFSADLYDRCGTHAFRSIHDLRIPGPSYRIYHALYCTPVHNDILLLVMLQCSQCSRWCR